MYCSRTSQNVNFKFDSFHVHIGFLKFSTELLSEL